MDATSPSSSSTSGDDEEVSDYELLRRQNMIQNRDTFAHIGFGDPYPCVDLWNSKTKEVWFNLPVCLNDVKELFLSNNSK